MKCGVCEGLVTTTALGCHPLPASRQEGEPTCGSPQLCPRPCLLSPVPNEPPPCFPNGPPLPIKRLLFTQPAPLLPLPCPPEPPPASNASRNANLHVGHHGNGAEVFVHHVLLYLPVYGLVLRDWWAAGWVGRDGPRAGKGLTDSDSNSGLVCADHGGVQSVQRRAAMHDCQKPEPIIKLQVWSITVSVNYEETPSSLAK